MPSGRPTFGELFRLVSDISELVAQTSLEHLPDTLGEILHGARFASDLSRGTISLLDYAFGDLYVLEAKDSAPKLSRQKVSEAVPLPHRQEVSPRAPENFANKPSDALLTLPLITGHRAGRRQIGDLYFLSQSGPLEWSPEQENAINVLTNLAAIAIERCRRQRDTIRWQDAFSDVFAASRIPRAEGDVDHLLTNIAQTAQRLSGADFTVLYEYFEEHGDVRLPPVLAGEVRKESILHGRGMEIEHKQSVIFQLLSHQIPVFAEDAPREWHEKGLLNHDAASEDRTFFGREGVVSSAGIPLRIESESVGVLFLNYRTPQTFSPGLRENLKMFANQAALAIGNARFFLRSERYSQNLETLNRIGREFGSAVTRDIHQIGALIDEQTRSVIPTKNLFLCLYDTDTKTFDLPYLRDQHDPHQTLARGLHEGLTAYVCRTGKALLATREQQKVLFAQGKARLVGNPSAVWLGAPLKIRDKVIGALVVQDYDNEGALNSEHLQLLEAIASQAATAIDNYRLFRKVKLQLSELSALLKISQTFSKARLSATQLLSAILDRLCKITRCHGSLLLLIDPGDKSRLRVTASSRSLTRYLGRTMPIGTGVSGTVAQTGKSLIVHNYLQWEGRCDLFDPPPQQVCAVPLVSEGAIIGAITLSSESTKHYLSRREVDTLKRFAGPAAIAVQNARDNSFRNALVDAGPNAIVAVDRTGNITMFNDEAARLFKYSSGTSLLNKSVTTLYWGGFEEAQRVQMLLDTQGKVKDLEIFGRTVSEEKIPLSLVGSILKDETGEILGSVGILEDQRIQSLRGRAQTVVSALREISDEEELGAISDLVVLRAVELLYASAGCIFIREDESFEVRSPYGQDEVLYQALVEGIANQPLATLASSDDPQNWQTFFLPDDPILGDIRLRPDTRSAVLVPIRSDRRLHAFLLIESCEKNHFNSDQKLLEVLASQAAVSINRVQLLRYREETLENLHLATNAIAVGQITTTFIHEAKNALNGMSLTLLGLMKDIGSEATLKSREDYLDRLLAVQSELTRFDDLSRRLQAFSRQGLKPEKREVYLNEVISRTLELLRSALRKHGVKEEVRLHQSLDAPSERGKGNPILVDEYQVQQVLMNIILNAIAALPDRGRLLIETKNFADHVEARVTDYGEGISEDTRRRLFQPFFTTRKDGVGLGLFLSKILIERNHNGRIEVFSSGPGKGSTFAIYIPKHH